MVSIEEVNTKIDKLIAMVKTRPLLKYNSAKVVYMLELLKEALGKGAL